MENLIKNFEEKEKFFSFVIDQIDEAVMITSLDFKIIYINPSGERIFGYSKEELRGQTPIILNAEKDPEGFQQDIYNHLSMGKKWEGTILNRRKDGSLFSIHLISIPYVEHDHVVCYVGFQKDIDDLIQAKSELETSRNKYKTIFESAPHYINLVDSKGIIIDSNSKIYDVLGYTKEEIIGQHYSKIVHPDYLSQAEDDMKLLMQKKRTRNVIQEYKMIKKNKEIITIDARTAYVLDSKGEFLHTVCFITDVSDRKHKEEELEKLATNLRKSNEELEQFAYIASHDLQEPLRVVYSYCQILQEIYSKYSDVNQESSKYFSYVMDAILRMKSLISSLLDFSRAGREERPFEEVDVTLILKDVLRDLQVLITETDADVLVDTDLPHIFAVPFRVKQLFLNLISNSLKFRSDMKPVVEIGFSELESEYTFYVKDNGIGIEEKYFNRIFGIFKRIYSREKYPGNGIGLAICKKIVEFHNGRIWIESEVGKGTCVYFTFPKINLNKNFC